MSIRISSISVTPNETTVGQPITVTIAANEIDWDSLSNDFTSWGEVKWSFENWNKVKNYIYSKPVADNSNSLQSSDGFALLDWDGKQLSITGGYISNYSASTIRDFLREVYKLNGD